MDEGLMNIHVHHVLSKCVDAILAAFMYLLGNIPIGYKEIWYLPLLLSERRNNYYTIKKACKIFTVLPFLILKIPDLAILWHP